MAKVNNIFKASELINRFPELGSNIMTEDYIHVAMIEDYDNNRIFLFSYIWDTREIVKASAINEGFDMDPIIKAMRYNEDTSLLAEDNLQQIKARCNLNVCGNDFMTAIDWLNENVMTNHTNMTLVATESGSEVLYTTENDIPIAATGAYTEQSDKETTFWLKSQLNTVFGWHSDAWYALNGFNNEDRVLNIEEIKSKLKKAFNVKIQTVCAN